MIIIITSYHVFLMILILIQQQFNVSTVLYTPCLQTNFSHVDKPEYEIAFWCWKVNVPKFKMLNLKHTAALQQFFCIIWNSNVCCFIGCYAQSKNSGQNLSVHNSIHYSLLRGCRNRHLFKTFVIQYCHSASIEWWIFKLRLNAEYNL